MSFTMEIRRLLRDIDIQLIAVDTQSAAKKSVAERGKGTQPPRTYKFGGP
jgi:hypothetical protein